MPTKDHSKAIIRWRQGVESFEGGLAVFQQSATVSTMLFGCRSWLRTHAGEASPAEVAEIERVKSELEHWMSARGLTYTE